MIQLSFFDRGNALELTPRDPNTPAEDRPRLSGQNARILKELRRGPKTNTELAAISLKYTSRISDLRAAGFHITCGRGLGGLNVYTLED